MNILVYRWEMYPYHDIIRTLKKQGHHIDVLSFPLSNREESVEFTNAFCKLLPRKYDLVFSVNFFTAIAILCYKYQIPYAAWTCDAPLLAMLHPSICYPTTYLFTFDKKDHERLCQKDAAHPFYLPLSGIDLEDTSIRQKHSQKDDGYLYDISFVGNLYERNRYQEMCSALPDYLCGYMDAAIEAQKNISGANILLPMLNDSILLDLSQYTNILSPDAPKTDAVSLEALRLHFATSVLSYKTAADIRCHILNTLAFSHDTHLFTNSQTDHLTKNVRIHPAAEYHTEMPKIFSHTKINLNLTIPNIENGIPLRVFDVLSAGGFLLTDYRTEICTQFENEVDLVVFEGISDLQAKIDYYLSHPARRKEIAKNGQKKVQELHSYDKRIRQLLHSVFPKATL